VRKPDERFVEIRDGLDKFQDCLTGVDRSATRGKNRVLDLSADYEDMAAGIQGLGYLESGITDPLTRFENGLIDFSSFLRESTTDSTEPFLHRLNSLYSYSQAFSSVLKLRDQKQLDFEELSTYLSSLTSERDRVAGGYRVPVGIGGYLKERLEGLRGNDSEMGRDGRLRKLDGKITELNEAVTGAQDVLDAFNEEVLGEHEIFQVAKRTELKSALSDFADGQIEYYKKSVADWDKVIPFLSRIQVD